jgi:DNA-binding transcriptional regulator GbsR (MarR family)
MTRTYIAKRLLEHGPLTFSEFREITGWPPNSCSKALDGLRKYGVAILYHDDGRRFYRLAD